MNDVATEAYSEPPIFIPRETLCFSRSEPGQALYKGQEGYEQQLQSLYSVWESNAAEELVNLKSRLRSADTDVFWPLLVQGLANLAGAQYAFVSKRVVVDDENLAVEMPPLGEKGSCLMAAAFYFNDGKGTEVNLRNMKYHAYSCPCAYMRHDKILIIPDRLSEFILDNPNNLAVPAESYLGVPLFADGKCFAHFGVMWTADGVARRKLGWGFLEMLFHALEDMILDRVLAGQSFAHGLIHDQPPPSRIVPHEAISTAQSLKPYARSLSHELRTPMQGVVGMLDVMYATVQEAAEDQRDPRVRKVLNTLKESIEIVQDSSRRAVEAADNVVHAYDMNMGMPDETVTASVTAALSEEDADHVPSSPALPSDKRPAIVVTGNNLSLNLRNGKRRRGSLQWGAGTHPKRHKSELSEHTSAASHGAEPSYPSRATANLVKAMATAHSSSVPPAMGPTSSDGSVPDPPVYPGERAVVPGLRHTNLRDVLRYVMNDSLKVGGRPESAVARETEHGEIIEVMTRSSSGVEKAKVIEWSVGLLVPESILIDERDMTKMISCVILNALKFTEEGRIGITVDLSPKGRNIVINVKDTGPGIPTQFLPRLFKPFSREDDSLTRQSEGLGLGLMVAKGLSRKLGGDVRCVRSETSGPDRGSDFELKFPLTPGDVCSRGGTPHSSPTPSARSRHSHSADGDRATAERCVRHTPPVGDGFRRSPRNSHQMASSTTPSQPSHLVAPAAGASPAPSSGRRYSTPGKRPPKTKSDIDRNLARKHPLNFLVVEDNKINRKLLVSMLYKLGYTTVREAYDGADAVRQWSLDLENGKEIDVVLMDLWMPYMDGYEATERILSMAVDDDAGSAPRKVPTILAVTADVTDGALERAAKVGMKGFMTKPYKLRDLEKLIVEYCARQDSVNFA